MISTVRVWLFVLLVCVVVLTFHQACTGEHTVGKGTLAIAVSGGNALREGFPHKEGDAIHAFKDGWSLRFSKYIVVLGNIELKHPESGEVVGGWKGEAIMDLLSSKMTDGKAKTPGSEDLISIENLPARRLDISFELLRASDVAENRSAHVDGVQKMIANQWSVLAEGEANRDQTAVKFVFGLSLPTHYYDCINGKDQTKGIAIENNKTTGVFIYTHVIHIFWDSLASGDENLRFDAFAAMAKDGVVDAESLANQDLTALRDADGKKLTDSNGKVVFYNDGGLLPPDRQNLLEFLKYAIRDSAHFNGVGLCKIKIPK
jgi:hypothetical protein